MRAGGEIKNIVNRPIAPVDGGRPVHQPKGPTAQPKAAHIDPAKARATVGKSGPLASALFRNAGPKSPEAFADEVLKFVAMRDYKTAGEKLAKMVKDVMPVA